MTVDRAAEMRSKRELFEFAMRENITMAEAKARLAKERHAAASARLAAKLRCGTDARQVQGDEGDRPLPFYQQGQYA